MRTTLKPLEWTGRGLRIIDQTRLPGRTVVVELRRYQDVIDAIKRLRVRGAPVIGIAAAYGVALGAAGIKAKTRRAFDAELAGIFDEFAASRPTAVDLFNAIARLKNAASQAPLGRVKEKLVAEAKKLHAEQVAATVRLSAAGAALLHDGDAVLTHCNAGPLAASGEGTALGVVRVAASQGKHIAAFATETRPLLQGARLTTCELMAAGVPVTLVTDSMAGYLMSQGKVNAVIVGADRVAANGDAANKIGTYSLAVLARAHRIPFYVAAPRSTFDPAIGSGKEIPIEERSPEEVTHIGRKRVAPRGVKVYNPAFDVTPARYITALITDMGVIPAPSRAKIKKALGR